MIGLLGTLKGMIGAFSAIAISGTQLKASQVAGNISEALVLTFEGVALSVPAIYFFALFRNRISSFTATAMLDADAFRTATVHVDEDQAPSGRERSGAWRRAGSPGTDSPAACPSVKGKSHASVAGVDELERL